MGRAILVFVGTLVGITVFAALSALWSGYVLTLLWLWFIVPTFGLPVLGLVPAIGFALTVRFLTSQMSPKEDDALLRSVIHAILFPLVGLGIGYVVKGFL